MVVAIVPPPPRPRSFCARAPYGSRLFEIELKVALAGKESVIAEKNEIVTTARADTARARTALRMAIRRQAARRAARAATVQRRAGMMAASDAILEAVEDRDEAVGAADRRATAAEQRRKSLCVARCRWWWFCPGTEPSAHIDGGTERPAEQIC